MALLLAYVGVSKMIRLTRSQLMSLAGHLEAAYPNEACGLLVGRREGDLDLVAEARPVPNATAARRGDRYEMDPAELLAAERAARAAGASVLGVFHSHPDGAARPSPVDLERAWDGYVYLIVSIREGRAGEWNCWILKEKERKFASLAVRLED